MDCGPYFSARQSGQEKRKDTNPQVSFPSMPMYTGLPAFQLVPVGVVGRIPSCHADRIESRVIVRLLMLYYGRVPVARSDYGVVSGRPRSCPCTRMASACGVDRLPRPRLSLRRLACLSPRTGVDTPPGIRRDSQLAAGPAPGSQPLHRIVIRSVRLRRVSCREDGHKRSSSSGKLSLLASPFHTSCDP